MKRIFFLVCLFTPFLLEAQNFTVYGLRVKGVNTDTTPVVAPPVTTTPAPPVITANDSTNILSAYSPLGLSEILVSIYGGTYGQYAGPYNLGDNNVPYNSYLFKIRSAPYRNESAVVGNPAFTATVPPVVNNDTVGYVYGQIPWLPYRAFVEDYNSNRFDELQDGSFDNVDLAQSALVNKPDMVIAFDTAMHVRIKQILYGDGQHNHNAGDSMPSWFLDTATFARIPGPGFYGNSYYQFDTMTLVNDQRTDYFIMQQYYPIPTELKFFGWYKPVATVQHQVQKTLIDNQMGAVSYSWNFQLPSAGGMDTAKMRIAKAPNIYRMYMDIGSITEANTGKFIFQPMNGAWQTDAMLDSLKRIGKDVIFCIKGNEGLPSYIDAVRQVVIRYGNNQNVSDSLTNVFTGPGYPGNTVKKGLNLITKIQLGNEPNRWWKGRFSLSNPEGMMTPFELAAQWKLCYDAAKAIDPNIEVISPGLATNTPAYFEGAELWAKMFNGGVFPLDAIAYHEYNNTESGQNQTGGVTPGVAPEAAGMLQRANTMNQALYEIAPNRTLKDYITETGYSISTLNPTQAVPANGIGAKDRFHVQGDWSIRSALVTARSGMAGVTFYQLYDDDNYRYNDTVYMNWDLSCGIATESITTPKVFALRPAAKYFQQATSILHGYTLASTSMTVDSVFIDKFTKTGQANIYSIVRGTSNGGTTPYTLSLPGVPAVEVNLLNDTSLTTKKTVYNINGSYSLSAGETPIFIRETTSPTTPVLTLHTFYIDNNGNDGNDGHTIATAWKTVNKVNSTSFSSVDTVLFNGGQTFSGGLYFQANRSPYIVSSYGSGKATISSGLAHGLYAYNVGNIQVTNLNLIGSNSGTTNYNGIYFYSDKNSNTPSIIIDKCNVSNYTNGGVYFFSYVNGFGFNNVRITNTVAHDNGSFGIYSMGYLDQYNNSNFYIGNDTAYNNLGRSDITNNNTGNGIVISGVNGWTIEHSLAYQNGANNAHQNGGPVGIWCWNAKNGVMQYNESHHNHAGTNTDGGGFDIDGGSQNVVSQYNYSHDNEGAGQAFFEYGSSNQFQYDTIRYNISQNDGIGNAQGNLGFWANATSNKISNSQVYNNVFYASNSAIGGTVDILNTNESNVKVFNNIFYTTSPQIMKGDASAITWANNDYYSTGSSNFSTGGVLSNPLFTSPGNGVNGYTLQSTSPMIDAGQSTNTTVDFYGNSVPKGNGVDVGVNETIYSVQQVQQTLHTYYIDSLGNDNNTGKSQSQAWKTITKLNSSFSSFAAGDSVTFNRGQSFYGNIVIPRSDITISAYGTGNKPKITGSVAVSNWTSLGGGIYETSLSIKPNLVSINGTPYAMGRFPNAGYLSIDAATSNTSITDAALTGSWTGAEIVIRKNRWVIDRGNITSQSGTTLNYSGTSSYAAAVGWGYFLQNSFAALDQFGEWFYNSSTGKIDVYFGSNAPANYYVRASASNDIITATNTNNIVIDNLFLEGANAYAVDVNGGSNFQVNNCDISNTGVNAMYYQNTTNAKIQNTNITNTQNNGIYFISGNSSGLITGNTIRNTFQWAGMGQDGDQQSVAMQINGESNTIANNNVINSGYIGIEFNKGSNILIKNNFVDSSNNVKDDGGGIYTFEGGSTVRSNNQVIGNIITNSQGNNQGAGGSYANLLLGYGIYLDLNTNNVLVQGNTVNKTGYWQMFWNAARNITVRNNTFFGHPGLVDLESINLSPTYPYLPIRNIVFKNNLLFVDTIYNASLPGGYNMALQLINTASQADLQAEFASASDIDSNFYCRPLNESTNPLNVTHYGSAYTATNYTLSQWLSNSNGWDVHSHGSPTTFTDPTYQKLLYNTTSSPKTFTLTNNYIDVNYNNYSGSVVLQPYTSLVLFQNTLVQ